MKFTIAVGGRIRYSSFTVRRRRPPCRPIRSERRHAKLKSGDGKGYAGSVNALFYADNCNMVYGDAQAVFVR